MQTRLLLKEDRIKLKKQGEYFEAHHIVPKSMGGNGKDKEYRHPNLVLLTGREHYIAHALLWLLYRTREMALAFKLMCTVKKNNKGSYIVSSRLYEQLKKDISRLGMTYEQREKMMQSYFRTISSPGYVNKNRGRKRPLEAIEKTRQANLGKKRSPEHKEKIRRGNLDKVLSLESKEKIRQANLGKVLSSETKEKIRQASLGKVFSSEAIAKRTEAYKRNVLLGLTKKRVCSSETKEKIRQAHLGKKIPPEIIAKRVETRKKNRLLKLAQVEVNGGQGG